MAGCYVFFRCWPGFTEPFPFERFNALPDDELASALDAFAREQLRLPEVRGQIKEKARGRRRRFIEAIMKQSKRRMGGASSVSIRRLTPHESPRTRGAQMRWDRVRCADRRTDPLVCRLGAYLGWWQQGKKINGRSVGFPAVWVWPAASLAFAEQLVKELNRRRDLDYHTHELEYLANPRFGFISADGLSDGQHASMRRCINAIQEGREPDVQGGGLALVIGRRAAQVARELAGAWPNRSEQVNATQTPCASSGEPDRRCRSEGRDMGKVFISYSHDSAEHCECVLQLANALRSDGVDAELDRYHVRPPEGWPLWCERQLRPDNSKFVLMICTETYRSRVENRVHADEGRGVFWEGCMIYDYIYDAKGNTRFIPVLLSGATADCIPIPIRHHTRYYVERFDLGDVGYQDLYRELTGQPAITKPALGHVVSLGVQPAAAAPLDPRPVETTFPTFASSHEAPRSPQGETAATEVGEIQRLQREALAASRCSPENRALFEQKLNEIDLLDTLAPYQKVAAFQELGQEVALNSDRGTCLLVQHILWHVAGWDRASIVREIMEVEAARSLVALVASALWDIGVNGVEYGRSQETIETLTRAILEVHQKARLIGAQEALDSCRGALDSMLSRARSDKRADVIGLVEQAVRNLDGRPLPPN